MDRRDFLGIVGGTAVSLALPELGFSAEGSKAKKPNFIFILGDDWGWGDLACYGHQELKTPNIDRLARQGLLFTQFYVNAPTCSPSRAALMTGRYPARYRIHCYLDDRFNKERGMADYLDPKAYTITKLLKNEGYVTAHYGKWHLGGGQNFPDFATNAPPPGQYGIDNYRTVLGNGPTWDDIEGPGWWARSTELFVNETIRFIEDNRDKPFYVNTWLLDPHTTLDPTEEQMKPYDNPDFSPPPPVDKKYKGVKQIYYSAVTNADRQIGRLLDKLDELGLADNTIVIFSSDNGPEDIHLYAATHSGIGSPGPFRGRKRSLYEGGVRTPFIVRWPAGKIPAGKVDNTSVISGVDLLPTFCSLAGVKLPADLAPDGEDISETFSGKPKQRKKPLMWEYIQNQYLGYPINKSPMLAIRSGKWKLLMNPDRSRVELYDILKDPMEVDNLADRYPKMVEELSAELQKWKKTLPQGVVGSIAGSNEYPWPKEQR
jgi:arylsulfatase A-like enzyme